MREKKAAIIVIGNEILSGKIADENGGFLLRELHDLGVAVQRMVVIPDDVEEIAGTVKDCSARFDFVFTSGGMGPTHDDVTIDGIAAAFGRRIIRHPGLLAAVHESFPGPVDESRLRLADAPEGTELIYGASARWPVLATGNVYILPGVPSILRAKFAILRERFRAEPFHMVAIFTREDEFDLAARLNQAAETNPDVAIGSYPDFDAVDYRVRITVESINAEAVQRVRDLLLELLDSARVVRVEG